MSADEQKISKTKLFIGNLPFVTGEEDIRELFSGFGEISSISLITDRQTGRSRGFAFIEFATLESAQAAVDENGNLEVDGRKLVIREAQDRKERPSFDGGNRGGGGFRPNSGFRGRSNDRYDRNR